MDYLWVHNLRLAIPGLGTSTRISSTPTHLVINTSTGSALCSQQVRTVVLYYYRRGEQLLLCPAFNILYQVPRKPCHPAALHLVLYLATGPSTGTNKESGLTAVVHGYILSLIHI